jgi:hypothetical protein
VLVDPTGVEALSLNPTLFASRRPIGFRLAGAAALLATLSACGGGGGSDAGTSPVPETPAASLDLSGTAAVGKALAGATVNAKCATGSNTATAGPDGVFRLSIPGGALPCVLQAVSGSTTLHSVATGTGRSATANISPLTELVVAQANGGDAAALFTSFDAAAQAKVSSTALSAATSSVQTALASVVDIAGVNPFTDSLVADTGSGNGNPLDKKLDTLGTKLGAAKLTLAELISTIVRNGASAAAVVSSQVKPASSHCASLRSGSYVVLNPSEDAANLIHQVTLDAETLTSRTASTSGGAEEVSPAVVPVAGKPCHYRSADGREDLVVSSAGVILNRYVPESGSTAARLGLAIPKQTIAAAELAGTWNTVEFGPTDNTTNLVNSYAVATIDNTGTNIAVNDCKFLAPCADAVPVRLAPNPAGGFDATSGDGQVLRLFAYKAASGNILLAGIGASGQVIIGSRQSGLVLPTNGESQTYWDVSVNARGEASALFADVRTITAVDAAAGSYTRSASFGGNRDGFTINSPRNGLRTRATCINSSGATVACGMVALPLTGMGMTVYGSSVETSAFYGISVARPAGSTSTGVQSVDTPSTGAAAPNTLVINGGETYPLRVNLTIDANGLVNGGAYDFHKLNGTMTPCTYSPALQDVCFGTSAGINSSSQNGAFTTQGAANPISLMVGPDVFGITFTGTVTGKVWSGTWTQAANQSNGSVTRSGTFAVDLVITQQ